MITHQKKSTNTQDADFPAAHHTKKYATRKISRLSYTISYACLLTPTPHYFSPATDRNSFTFTPISYVNSCNTTGSTFLYTLEADKTTPPTVNKSRSIPTPNNHSFSSKYGLTNPQSLSVTST